MSEEHRIRDAEHRRSVRESGDVVTRELWLPITAHARRLGLTREGAEDATQDAFGHLLSQRPELDCPEAWLRRTVERRIIDLDRHSRIEAEFAREAARSGQGAVAGADLDRHLWIAAALRGLSPKFRRLLYLRFWEGATNAEVAAETGYRQESIKTLVKRALKRLRRELERVAGDRPSRAA